MNNISDFDKILTVLVTITFIATSITLVLFILKEIQLDNGALSLLLLSMFCGIIYCNGIRVKIFKR